MKVLVVDDEQRIADFISKALRSEGYQTDVAYDGNAALELIGSSDFDLVILDILMPGKSGLDVLEDLRGMRPSPFVLLLTAKDDLKSKVDGLNLGADDYLTKPFELEELIARIRAVTRRTEMTTSTVVKLGDASLDLLSREITSGNLSLLLSTKEFALLDFLIQHPNQVLSREQILNRVWGYAFDPNSNIVDVYVRYLRQKLAQVGEPSLIETVRGAGYRAALK